MSSTRVKAPPRALVVVSDRYYIIPKRIRVHIEYRTSGLRQPRHQIRPRVGFKLVLQKGVILRTPRGSEVIMAVERILGPVNIFFGIGVVILH